MRLYILLIVLFLTTPALGDDCKVVEYPDHNEVVCEGQPGSSQTKTSSSPDLQRAEYLSSEIDRLSREGDEILKRTGKETTEELKIKRTKAGAKYDQMKVLAEEMRLIVERKKRDSEELKEAIRKSNEEFERKYKP